MKVGMAYLVVVLIWSTTPLGIKWSNSSLSFVTAITSRVFIALIICLVIMAIMRKPLVARKQDWYAYFAGTLGLFPNMLLVYWSAQHIPSGLAAVIFGMDPFSVGLFSWLILKENIFNSRRVIALLVAVAGLGIINVGQFTVGGNALYGVLGMAASTIMFGLSSVWLKRVGGNVDPLRQSTGVLLLSAPLLAITWFMLDGVIPSSIDSRSLLGVAYLATAGSVLGGTTFFYVLKNCSVASVGLITFITPVTALLVGAVVDDESFTLATVSGSALIILSLGIYQNLFRQFYQLLAGKRRTGSVVPE